MERIRTSGKIKYNIQGEPIVISKSISDLFLKQSHPDRLMALYWFYYYTAKWQQTNQPKCTTEYVSRGLNWGKEKVRKVKKELARLHLIEDIKVIDPGTGKITGWYIQVHFIWGSNKNHPKDLPHTGFDHTVGNPRTNALSTSKVNALSTIKENLLKNGADEKLIDVFIEWLEYKKVQFNFTYKNPQKEFEKFIQYSNNDSKTAKQIIKISIDEGYQGYFKLRTSKKKSPKQKPINISGHQYQVKEAVQILTDNLNGQTPTTIENDIVKLYWELSDIKTRNGSIDSLSPASIILSYADWLHDQDWIKDFNSSLFRITGTLFKKFIYHESTIPPYINLITGK